MHCPRLEVFQAEDADFDDRAVSHLQTPRMRQLFLDDASVGNDGVAHIADMPELTMLGLTRTRVTDAGLKQLSRLRKLEYLGAGETSITDRLYEIQSLQDVEIHRTKCTKAGAAALRAALPNF